VTRLAERSDLKPPEAARLLSYQTFLYGLAALDADSAPRRAMRMRQALGAFAAWWAEYRDESPSQDALQMFCRILRTAARNAVFRAAAMEFFPCLGLDSVSEGETSGPDGPKAGPAQEQTKEAEGHASETPRGNRVRYLGPDRTTRGDWCMFYGSAGWVLAAMGQISDWRSGRRQVAYQLTIPAERDKPRLWLNPAHRAVADPRALIMNGRYEKLLAFVSHPSLDDVTGPLLPGERVRRPAWWDDHGEQHAFDERGPDLDVHVRIPEGLHRLAFYVVDFDWQGTWHPRQQALLVFDGRGRLLNGVWTGKFGGGVYERFAVRGPLDLTVRFFKNRSACVAVSGIFLDRIPALPRFADLQSVVPRSRRDVIPDWAAAWDRLAAEAVPGDDERSPDVAGFWQFSRAAQHILRVLEGNVDSDARARLAYLMLAAARGEWRKSEGFLLRGLRREREVRAVGALLRALLQQPAIPAKWKYLTAARYLELVEKAPAARVQRDLRRAMVISTDSVLYPLRHWLFAEWRRRSFPVSRYLGSIEREIDACLGLRPRPAPTPAARVRRGRLRTQRRSGAGSTDPAPAMQKSRGAAAVVPTSMSEPAGRKEERRHESKK